MVLNGLGFVNRALYIFPGFFRMKPTERLIGKGIQPEHLNDDILGRALDKLYEYDVTNLFTVISAKACKQLGLEGGAAHLDSSSLHTDGQYDRESEEGVISLCKGYSRDHRPDLNQVIIDLIVENKAGIPLLMKPESGNSSDKTNFCTVINEYIDQLTTTHGISYWVADSALYTAENLKCLEAHKGAWITRVPETLTLAQEECRKVAADTELLPDYRYRRVEVEYAGIKQRWLVITSKSSLERAAKNIRKKMEKQSKKEHQLFERCCKKYYACQEDAEKDMLTIFSAFQVLEILDPHVVHQIKGKQAGWVIQGNPASLLDRMHSLILKEATFIIGTNELDETRLSDLAVLQTYKDQQKVERGFRFLKDPMFQANTLFLKSPQRITALLMIMTLCLMVYAALEYRLREALATHAHVTVPDQQNRPTKRPTMRWIFQLFSDIHVFMLNKLAEPLILNKQEYHQTILRLLGAPYQTIYS
jgi:transposase